MERWFFIKREKAYYRKWTNRARGYVKEVIELKQNISMVQVGRVSYSFCVSLTQSNNNNEQDYIDGLRVVGNWHDKASWKNAYSKLRSLLRYEPSRLIHSPEFKLAE